MQDTTNAVTMRFSSEEKKEAPKVVKTDYSKLVVPLARLFRNVPKALSVLNRKPCANPAHKDNGPYQALVLTLNYLKQFYKTLHENNATQQLANKIKIGFIKETKDKGNTSVSMGCAIEYFKENPDHTHVVFLNCGTGGIKKQCYTLENGVIRLVAELKGDKDKASPNALEIGTFKPKGAIEFNENKSLLIMEVQSALSIFNSKYGVPMHTRVHVFVTGTVRQQWEEADEEKKQLFETTMKNYFELYCSASQSSYFITQEDEGRLELLGTSRMYAQAGAGEVCASFGIGRGSTQLVFLINGVEQTVPLKKGMNDSALGTRAKELLAEFLRSNISQDLPTATACAGPSPIVALKSGTMLLLEMSEYADVRATLIRRDVQIWDINETVQGPDSTNDCTPQQEANELCARHCPGHTEESSQPGFPAWSGCKNSRCTRTHSTYAETMKRFYNPKGGDENKCYKKFLISFTDKNEPGETFRETFNEVKRNMRDANGKAVPFKSFLKARTFASSDTASVYYTFGTDGPSLMTSMEVKEYDNYRLLMDSTGKFHVLAGEVDMLCSDYQLVNDNETLTLTKGGQAVTGVQILSLEKFNDTIYRSTCPILLRADYNAWSKAKKTPTSGKVILSSELLFVTAFDDNAKTCMSAVGNCMDNVYIFPVNPVQAIENEDYFTNRIKSAQNWDLTGRIEVL